MGPECRQRGEKMICSQCNQEIPDGMKFCTNCGAKQVVRHVCPQCNREVQEGMRFCTNCGARVSGMPEQPVPPMAPVAPVQEPAPPMAPVAPVQEPVPPMTPVAPVPPVTAPQTPVPPVAASMPQVHTNYTQPQMQPRVHYSSMQNNVLQSGSRIGGSIPPEKPKKRFPVVPVVVIAVLAVAIGVLVAILIRVNNKNSQRDKATGNPVQTQGNPSHQTDPADPGNDPDINPGTNGTTNPVPGEDKKKTTVMMYVIGSNLEANGGCATEDFKEMLEADLEHTNIVIQTGGCTQWHNDIVKGNTCQRFCMENGNLVELENLGRVSMVEPETLTDFIRFAAGQYPAEKYVLVLWDHGGGVPIGYGQDDLFQGTLVDYELGNALVDAGVHFESVLFDACDMCTLEVALALKPSADYMLAAESLVDGVGMFYTNWLNTIDDDSVTSIAYGEQIITDYMASLKANNSVGSMSMIDLDRVDAVYRAYETYLEDLTGQLKRGNYAEYYKARNNCGRYEASDSVDLITLVTSYHTDYSTAVMNAVVNAVAYTESDYLYGHGIAAYSPFELIDQYSYGRESMVELGYSDQVLGFYDTFVSLYYGYQGDSYVDDYAGSWYDSDVVEEYVEEGTQAGNYVLETTFVDGREVIEMSDDFWDIVTDVTITTILMTTDTEGLLLGEDYYERTDSYGNILIAPPECWEYINNVPCAYYCLDEYTDPNTGAWSQTGCALGYVNDQDALLLIYFDEDYPVGTLLGYVPVDFETMESLSGDTYMNFEASDRIDLAFGEINIETGDMEYYAYGQPVSYSDTVLDYNYVNGDECYLITMYTIRDVYGNVYETEMFELGK